MYCEHFLWKSILYDKLCNSTGEVAILFENKDIINRK